MSKHIGNAPVPKLCGWDTEVGNFLEGLPGSTPTGRVASRLLLGEVVGLPAPHDGDALNGSPANAQDWGRRYLENGGCIYIDLDHLELCTAEVLSAYDHVAASHAMFRIARHALEAVNAKLPPGVRVVALLNNSDGRSNSYGSHVSVLLSRRAWNNLFDRKLHQMLYLASYQVSALVFTGQGKVGAENGRPAVAYQIAQRADFFETLHGSQTTSRRPIVNSRNEALCGRAATDTGGLARLHSIFFDNTLCHVASLLKIGVLQIVLAMLEADRIDPDLILDDPIDALRYWSHDPTLCARARLVSGAQLTAVELQLRFLERASQFVAAGGCEGVVPRAKEILALWEDTLTKLAARDFDALAPRLDWVLKLRALERAREQRPGLGWNAPELKHLDHLYGSLDVREGLYWAFERSGMVERVVSEETIARFVHEPPEDTRAWTRAKFLREAGPANVDYVDWDMVRVACTRRDGFVVSRTLDLPNPLGFTRAESGPIFAKARSLGELLDDLNAATRP